MARDRSRSRPRRASPKRSGARRSGGSMSWPLVIGAVAAVGLIVGLFFYQGRVAGQMAIDQSTLCPLTGPRAMTAVLIDVTDEMAPVQVSKLRELVRQQINQAEVGTEFSLGMVTDDASRLGSLVALCKPRAGGDVSAAVQNVRLVEERYKERFLDPLNGIFDQMLTATEAKQSPIMEGLQRLISETPGFVTFAGPKRVIIVSDLLQHSDAMSFYRGESWDSFRQSRASQRLSKDLGDADIDVIQIPRPSGWKGDPAVLEDFWIRYFDHQGAHLPKVRILGDL